MNKQIEEMYKDVYKAVEHNSVIDITHGGYIGINTDGLTRELYDDGYRKQTEGEWKAEKKNGQYGWYCTKCEAGFTGENAEWIAKSHDYCPKCGAKMKGGE